MELKDALQITAAGFAGLFAGNAMYIHAADHPARMQLDTKNLRMVWAEGFHRAKKFQGAMVLISAGSAAGVGYLEANADKRCLWFLGAGLFFTVWPYTVAVMFRDIYKNLDPDVFKKEGEEWSRNHIIRWNKQHGYRTAVSMIAFGIFLYGMVKK
ncbi:uncharacterized protein LOC127856159 [Dreissena polymorpha]|uniref:DUF1772 domain-containing protein n=1 Tax=Dreissena polymorpha TaxID=45954 RepID=A0A9D4CB75_DREPO|nr:uncharacterized protein LOC127856159 [Dreissena polymorpha]KAH3720313.1 hypothetical protein DPMN_063210 [Dreissena polymorpha]